jgi:hypothetical protein
MRRWKERIWPTINDESSALHAVERAVRITTIWAVINAALGVLLILSGSRITDRNPVEWQGQVLDSGGQSTSGYAFLFCGVLFGVVAWKIRGMSRGWALTGLILAAVTLLSDFALAPSPIALVFRATVMYSRLQSDQLIVEH